MQRHWSKDPAFWVVAVCFTLFVGTALAVFLSPKHFLQVRNKVATKDVGVHSRHVTLDARSAKRWVYYNLSEERIVHPRFVSSVDWDLAFKRYHVIANGGVTNIAAHGALADLGSVPFSGNLRVSSAKFAENTLASNGTDPENPAIRHWYNYDYASHILSPMPHVYLIRTPAGRYFALRILNYYCQHGESGCMTFEYVPCHS